MTMGYLFFAALALLLVGLGRDDEDDEPIVDEGDLPPDAVELPDGRPDPILTVDPGDGIELPDDLELPDEIEQPELPDLPELDENPEEPDTDFDERAIPNPNSLEGRVAAMLYDSEAAGQVVQNVPLLQAWKGSVGVLGAAELYGRGTARSLIARGIVPPNPWDWKDDREPSVYIAELEFMARQEPDRADLWLERAATVG